MQQIFILTISIIPTSYFVISAAKYCKEICASSKKCLGKKHIILRIQIYKKQLVLVQCKSKFFKIIFVWTQSSVLNSKNVEYSLHDFFSN